MEQLLACTGFEWDEENSDTSWLRHRVSQSECEQVFFNHPLVVSSDQRHSDRERRWFALGRTDAGRLLFLVLAIRADLIRVISARDMTRRERGVYHNAGQKETEPKEVDSEV